MKDFDSYKEEKNEGINSDAFSMFSSLASKYEGKSGEELLKAIVEEAERNKKNGTLKDEDIDNFAMAISPMLDLRQKKILEKVINKIKG